MQSLTTTSKQCDKVPEFFGPHRPQGPKGEAKSLWLTVPLFAEFSYRMNIHQNSIRASTYAGCRRINEPMLGRHAPVLCSSAVSP